jgi:hypothetical protein
MSFELSFSPEFFLNEGEPYDGGPEPSDTPTSVWHAIESMRVLEPLKWAELAAFFGCDPEHLTAETVFTEVEQTNTCSCLSNPVEVWIDPAGYWRLWVHEGAR